MNNYNKYFLSLNALKGKKEIKDSVKVAA